MTIRSRFTFCGSPFQLVFAESILVLLVLVIPCATAQDAVKTTNNQANKTLSVSIAEQGLPTTTSPGDGSMANWISQYRADERTLNQRFRLPIDSFGNEFRSKMLEGWLQKLDQVTFDKLDNDNQIDWLMLRSEIEHDRNLLERRWTRNQLAQELIPYLQQLQKYCASKEHGFALSAEEAASLLDEIATKADESTKQVKQRAKGSNKDAERSSPEKDGWSKVAPNTALDASTLLDQWARSVQETHRYHEGYDPKYTWWAAKPFDSVKQSLANHGKAIREVLAGIDENDKDRIVGVPIGESELNKELKHAWIHYTTQELIAIGERELKWCDDRFKEAADEMKLEGDWRKALNQVKSLHVEPGDQPRLIRELAWEAVRFLESHDLITIPEMAKYGWRVEMMSPEAQRVNPYFLGGDNIIVSFPTNTMTHSEKLMSLKSNNIHFCRATVHHELIPGHHLQYYSLSRYRPYREIFSSPFWMEGWALYWEMLLWDMGFAQSPEDKVGMLFWRRHRAARIIFSLNYQSGRWTAEECVKYLIDRVGHEPSAAAAEVRRSIMGGYGPLYQAGYMLGGLQLRSLHKEIVQTSKLSNREFHDAILRENYIPFELLRAKLLNLPLSKQQAPAWRFYSLN